MNTTTTTVDVALTSMFILTAQGYADVALEHLKAKGWTVSASERSERDGVMNLVPESADTNRFWYLSIAGIEHADEFTPGVEFVLITDIADEDEGPIAILSFAHLDSLLTKYGFAPDAAPNE